MLLVSVQSVSSLFSCLLKSFMRKYQAYSSARPLNVLRMAQSIALFSVSVSSAFVSLRFLSRVARASSVLIPFCVVVFLIVAVMSSSRRICLLKCWLRLFTSLYVSMVSRMRLVMAVRYRAVVAAVSSGVHGNGGICSGVGGVGMREMMYEIKAEMNIVVQVMMAVVGSR